jgi:hypothetical protein
LALVAKDVPLLVERDGALTVGCVARSFIPWFGRMLLMIAADACVDTLHHPELAEIPKGVPKIVLHVIDQLIGGLF